MPTIIPFYIPENEDMVHITHPMQNLSLSSPAGQRKSRNRGLSPYEYHQLIAFNKLCIYQKATDNHRAKWLDYQSALGQLNKLKFKRHN